MPSDFLKNRGAFKVEVHEKSSPLLIPVYVGKEGEKMRLLISILVLKSSAIERLTFLGSPSG